MRTFWRFGAVIRGRDTCSPPTSACAGSGAALCGNATGGRGETCARALERGPPTVITAESVSAKPAGSRTVTFSSLAPGEPAGAHGLRARRFR